MKFQDALDQLSAWCAQSGGKPIDIAAEAPLSFSCEKLGFLSEKDLSALLGWKVPEEYLQLLRAVGRSELFIDEYGLGIHIYSPSEARNVSQELWREWITEGVLPQNFCMIGHHSGLGDAFGFLVDRSGPNNFDIFCHEYPPYAYAETSDELKSWRTLEAWVIRLVESKGLDVL